MGQLKQLAGQTAIYGISSILGRTINFFLLPVYTAYLLKEDLGSFTSIYAFIAFFNVIFTYGMETAFFRFSTGKGLETQRVFSNAQSLILISSLVLGGLLFFNAHQLSIWLDYPGKAYLFQWTALILSIDAILAIPYAKLRAENKALKFALTKLLNILLNVGFNLFFIVFCYHVAKGDLLGSLEPFISSFYRPDWGVDYILLSNMLANALIIPVLLILTGKFKITLEKEILKPMWKYAVPLLFMGLAGVTNDVFSRFLFEYILPEGFYPGLTSREAAGVFGANFKLAIFMSLIIQAFKYAAEPFFFNQSTQSNSPELFAKVMHWFIVFCTCLMILVAVNLDILGPLFLRNEGYLDGLHIVPMLLMGYLLLGVYFNLSIWFKLTDQTQFSFYITFTGAVVTILVILVFVPRWGYIGGSMSTLATYLTMCIICFYYGQRYFYIPYQTSRDVFYLLLGFGLSYLGFFLDLGNPYLNFAIHNFLVLAFLLIVTFLEKKELSLIIQKIRN